MADPVKVSKQGEDWRYAALPNPFFSENSAREASFNSTDIQSTSSEGSSNETLILQTPQCGLKESTGETLTNHLPNFAGLLPQPFAILDSFDEGSAAVDTEAQIQKVGADSTAAAQTDFQRLRGIGLIGAVFNVLSKELGTEYSTAELMLAAQQLIDISKVEYAGIVHKDASERSGYYSWDLVRAFSHQWQIALVETDRMNHCDVDEYSPESFENAKLLIQGWNERTWEF